MQPSLHERDHPNVLVVGAEQVSSCQSVQPNCRLLYLKHSQADVHLLICMAVQQSNRSWRMWIASTTDKTPRIWKQEVNNTACCVLTLLYKDIILYYAMRISGDRAGRYGQKRYQDKKIVCHIYIYCKFKDWFWLLSGGCGFTHLRNRQLFHKYEVDHLCGVPPHCAGTIHKYHINIYWTSIDSIYIVIIIDSYCFIDKA